MISFAPRKLVNGATLRNSSGAHVAIFVNLENAERYARTVTGKTSDDIEVRLELDDPLNVDVNGWVQAIGVAKSPNTIQTKEVSDFFHLFKTSSTSGNEDYNRSCFPFRLFCSPKKKANNHSTRKPPTMSSHSSLIAVT